MQRKRHRGFTMLELLVVLLLVGLVVGMTMPRVDRALEAARMRSLQRDLRAVLEALPLQAFQQGQPLDLDASALLARLNPGAATVSIDLPQNLRYAADGAADGGDVWLRVQGLPAQRMRVARVTGQVVLDPNGQQP